MISTMEAEVRKRSTATDDTGSPPPSEKVPAPTLAGASSLPADADEHPAGNKQHGQPMAILRAVSFGVFFTTCIIA